jgi:hypothetical protein
MKSIMPEDTVNPSPIYAKPVDVLVLEQRFESATLGDLQQLDLYIPSSSHTSGKAVSI